MSESWSSSKRPYNAILDLYRIGKFGLPFVMLYCIIYQIDQIYFVEPYKVRTLILRETRKCSDLTRRHKTPSTFFRENPVRYWQVRYKNEMLTKKQKDICRYILYKSIMIFLFQCFVIFVWLFAYNFYFFKFPALTVIDRIYYSMKPHVPTKRERLIDIFNATIHCRYTPI